MTAKGRGGREPRGASRFRRRPERLPWGLQRRRLRPRLGLSLWALRGASGLGLRDPWEQCQAPRSRTRTAAPGLTLGGPRPRGLSPAAGHPSRVSPLWTGLAARTGTDRCQQGLSEAPLRRVWPRVDTVSGCLAVPHQVPTLCCDLAPCWDPYSPNSSQGSSS